MWIDQPAQVGFSYGKKLIDNDHNEEEVSEDMYNFLQAFFEAHPEYRLDI
jgi:carboxypeptidase C (cathepsin A)